MFVGKALPQSANLGREFRTALVALRGFFGDGPIDQGIHLWRQVEIERRCRKRNPVGYLVADGDSTVALKGPVTCDHVVKHHT